MSRRSGSTPCTAPVCAQPGKIGHLPRRFVAAGPLQTPRPQNTPLAAGGYALYLLGMSAPLIDPFARAITYLRVSVTDLCDFLLVF